MHRLTHMPRVLQLLAMRVLQGRWNVRRMRIDAGARARSSAYTDTRAATAVVTSSATEAATIATTSTNVAH